MTRETLDAWFTTVHIPFVLPEGEDFRAACACGWAAPVTELVYRVALETPCGAEKERREGLARYAAYLARRNEARQGMAGAAKRTGQ
jgi:hypothetical protein